MVHHKEWITSSNVTDSSITLNFDNLEPMAANKLLAFFENEYKKSRSKYIYVPTNLKDLADYLSINRSAMFRELKYLKEEKNNTKYQLVKKGKPLY